ncbi:Vps52 / Sac2 family protein [Trichomonas vaginalis G3]|uniref:Vps52 / Sac2 family protein n=1 Tax=Trichomonas vaginalis (strain ATCC PRA-98 / G3) TaxID=412133 RepID=A2EK21_TRIV3|nr:Golgi to vacuole transport [Trichomonas vaginalis G3]EAY07005.1 Vps52 / Sac2 family protein [Trichomonas vaginalis G3]KAI5488815.1 Golgi to vacuole transport [Trichomonas vaginalis G3]|eukprot:XP_001319228.1 Vps52 / Sac2 family protein [Trichomonas vaginalis G3]
MLAPIQIYIVEMSNVSLNADDPNFDETEQDISMFASVPSVAEVLANGNDLGKIYEQIGKQLEAAETSAINDYLQQLEDAAKIAAELDQSGKALAAIQELLEKFKKSLGNLSTEICTLQDKSETLTTKLGNRKNFENKYGEFTQSITLTRNFISTIMQNDVNANYVSAVEELHKKIQYIKSKDGYSTKAAQEITLPLDKLRVIASNNIRNWFVNIMNEMKETYGTEQVAIQHKMLKCKPFIIFLKHHSSDYEQSARDYYSQIMSRIYLENFKMLTYRLKRQMSQSSVTRENISGLTTSGFFFMQTKKIIGEMTNFFCLGDRIKLLNEILSPPQPFGDGVYPVESFFRSLYQTLIDTVTMEYKFSLEFFENETVSAIIFSETYKYLETFFDDLFNKINDPICIILLLRFVISFSNEMQRRKIDKVNNHLQNLTNKLTNRFQRIISDNVNAIKSVDPNMLVENNASPHLALAMTRRYSEFLKSMVQLLDESVQNLIMKAVDDTKTVFDKLLDDTSKKMSAEDLKPAFLINNYFLIIDTISTASNDNPILSFFHKRYDEVHQVYLDLVIKQQFPEISGVLSRSYSTFDNAKEEPIMIDISIDELKEIATQFTKTHSQKTKMIFEHQRLNFGDFDNGNDITKRIAMRIVFLWGRFKALVVKKNQLENDAPIPWLEQMVTPAQLATEYMDILNNNFKRK